MAKKGSRRGPRAPTKVTPLPALLPETPAAKEITELQEKVENLRDAIQATPNGVITLKAPETLCYKLGMMQERLQRCNSELSAAQAALATAVADRDRVVEEIIESLGDKVPKGYVLQKATFKTSMVEFTPAEEGKG